MKKKGYKGRCEKRSLLKCVGICRTYDHIQSAYADRLEANEQVKEFQCTEDTPSQADSAESVDCAESDDSRIK